MQADFDEDARPVRKKDPRETMRLDIKKAKSAVGVGGAPAVKNGAIQKPSFVEESDKYVVPTDSEALSGNDQTNLQGELITLVPEDSMRTMNLGIQTNGGNVYQIQKTGKGPDLINFVGFRVEAVGIPAVTEDGENALHVTQFRVLRHQYRSADLLRSKQEAAAARTQNEKQKAADLDTAQTRQMEQQQQRLLGF
jgi:hypothetical protein